jgi:transcriptional regulator GlxA family with amidase domain
MNIGVLIFHEVSEFEVAGIMGVFGTARAFLPMPEVLEGAEPPQNPLEVFTLSKTRASIRGAGGLVMTPTYAFAGAPEPNILIVPGGLRAQAARVKFLISISSGALLLGEAGLLTDLDVTTTPALLETIWKYNPGKVSEARAVKNPNGRWFASSGLSGLELSLELVALEFDAEIAGKASKNLGFA